MHYLKIEKNGLLLGVMCVLIITRLFGSYISAAGVVAAFVLFSAVLLFRRQPLALTRVDIAVVLVTLYELILPFTTVNPAPSHVYAMMGFYFFFSYFLFRLCLVTPVQFRTVLLCLSVVICFIAIVGIVSLVQFREQVSAAGFGSLYEFRYLLTPWGNPNNMWTTFLVAFTGIVLLAFFYCRGNKVAAGFLLLVFALLVWNGMASFSRTTYILLALVLAALSAAAAVNRYRRARLLLGTFILTAVAFCAANGPGDAAKTLRLHATASQQRSLDARCRDYSLAARSLEDNLLFGAGNGNYTLAINGGLYENDDLVYTNFASSGFVQLITEKGILGIAIWLFLFLAVLVSLLKLKAPDAYLVAGILVLLALKETTFAVFADFPNLQCLFVILIAGVLNMHAQGAGILMLSAKKLKYSYVVIAVLFIAYGAAFAVHDARNKKSDDLIAQVESGEMPASAYLALDSDQTSCLLNKAALQWERHLRTGEMSSCQEAVGLLRQAIARNPRDNMPRYNLALAYLHSGRTDEASGILHRLVQEYPDNSLFRIGLAKLLYRKGDIPGSSRQYACAILTNPGIMEDSDWRRLKNVNYQLYYYICNVVRDSLPYSTENPIQMAKNGKVLWELGDTAASASMLRKAVAALPNLGRAWYHLGIIADARQEYAQAKIYFKKALLFNPDDRFLQNYVSCQATAGANAEPAAERSYCRSRVRSYYLKFRTWYKAKPYRNQIYLKNIFDESIYPGCG